MDLLNLLLQLHLQLFHLPLPTSTLLYIHTQLLTHSLNLTLQRLIPIIQLSHSHFFLLSLLLNLTLQPNTSILQKRRFLYFTLQVLHELVDLHSLWITWIVWVIPWNWMRSASLTTTCALWVIRCSPFQ